MATIPTEKLDEDIRAVRADVAALRSTAGEQSSRLAEVVAKLGGLDDMRAEIKADIKEMRGEIRDLAVGLASLSARVNVVIGVAVGISGIFGVALMTALIGGAGRLSGLEAEARNLARSQAETRESISRHQTDPLPDLDARIARAVRIEVDAAVKRAATPQPER